MKTKYTERYSTASTIQPNVFLIAAILLEKIVQRKIANITTNYLKFSKNFAKKVRLNLCLQAIMGIITVFGRQRKTLSPNIQSNKA